MRGRGRRRGIGAGAGALVLVLAGCGGTAVEPGSQRSATPAEVVAAAREASVLVRARGCDFVASGSGFLADATHVVTNRHVVEDAATVRVRTGSGERAAVRRWFVARDSDLALLELARPVQARPLKVDPEPLGIGDPVAVTGYPDGGPLTVGHGEVSALVRPADLQDKAPAEEGPVGGSLVADVTVVPGSSGGPWVDRRGHVRAVTVATDVDDGSAIGIAGSRVAALYAGRNRGVVPAPC